MAKTRNLLIPGILFTLLVTIFFLLMLLRLGIGIDTSLILTAAWGILTGVLVASGYLSREYMQRRAFRGKKQAGATTDAHQERTIEIDLPFETAFDLALEALKTLDNQDIPLPDDPFIRMRVLSNRTQQLRLYKTAREMGTIHAGLRAKQLGIPDVIDFSKLAIQLQRIDKHTTRIHIESQPASLFDAYDMGKNLHYVTQLALYLRRESQQMNTTAGRLSKTDSADIDETPDTTDHFQTDTQQSDKDK